MAATTLRSDEFLHVLKKSEGKFEKYTKQPELFLGCRTKTAIGLLKIAKRVYDLYKKLDDDKKSLPQLMINGFDDEQIWQQIEIDNSSCKNRLIKRVAELATKRKTRKPSFKDQIENEDETDGESSTQSEEEEEEEEVKEEITRKKRKISSKNASKCVLDDKFFKYSEMEEFVEAEEAKIEGKMRTNDDEEIDYFEAIPSTDEDADSDDDVRKKRYKYDEFFDEISEGDNEEEMECEEDEFFQNGNETFEENDDRKDGIKSTIEIRREKLKGKIKDLEESNLAEKPWQLMGEATAYTRPENSLLQEHALFDHVQRQAPVITEETTQKLEDIIKQRIKDQAWNDVERKVKPVEQPFEFKKRIVLNQEKSKISLSKEYENIYTTGIQPSEKKEEELPEHVEIKKMMSSLFYKLDTLSNFHFTPKPVVPELKIVSNLPSIAMEEVGPTTASLGSLLAPADIMAPSAEKGEREKDKTDKLRQRRLKKKFQSSRRKEKEEREKLASKLNPTKNKYNKEKLLKELVNKVEKAEMKDSKQTRFSSNNAFKKLNDITKQESKKKLKKT